MRTSKLLILSLLFCSAFALSSCTIGWEGEIIGWGEVQTLSLTIEKKEGKQIFALSTGEKASTSKESAKQIAAAIKKHRHVKRLNQIKILGTTAYRFEAATPHAYQGGCATKGSSSLHLVIMRSENIILTEVGFAFWKEGQTKRCYSVESPKTNLCEKRCGATTDEYKRALGELIEYGIVAVNKTAGSEQANNATLIFNPDTLNVTLNP